jgi:unsaturated rhamnogalacturonyl hydrolase
MLEHRFVPAQIADAPRVIVIGSLQGDAATRLVVQLAYEAYVNSADNFLDVTFIANANPNAEALSFPPPAPAYGGNWPAWSLWHFVASHAPDLVILAGGDSGGLQAALTTDLAGLGPVPVISFDYENELIAAISGRKTIAASTARLRLQARAQRSDQTIAAGLSQVYGNELNALTYIPAMALIGKLQLGMLAEVEAIVAPTLASNETLNINNSLQIAGHLLFAELAERTGSSRYLQLAKRAADLGFDAQGQPLAAMPFHGDYSDAFFMATPLLAKVGKLTGEPRYVDLALRHVEFLHAKLLRQDGLYNHWPRAEAAWGRGNAFVALGLALALTNIPPTHAAYARLLALHQRHLKTLLNFLNSDNLWHNIIDDDSSWSEHSATTMIALAMQRGASAGRLESHYLAVANSAWQAVIARTDEDFGFLDVCESTPGQDSFAAYRNRNALTGRDERAGGMLLYLASERLAQRQAAP